MEHHRTREIHSGVHVVIIGASYGGVKVAHRILKEGIAGKVTLVSPDRNFFFNIATPRVAVNPQAFRQEQYLFDVTSLFSQYPSVALAFVEGKATAISHDEKCITVDGVRKVSFDYLIIASGSSYGSSGNLDGVAMPWKARDNTMAVIVAAQQKIAKSTSFIICGGGPVGVEFAGELSDMSSDQKKHLDITVISAAKCLLPALPVQVGAHAESILRAKGVRILKNQRIMSAEEDDQGRWKVGLDDATQLSADCFVRCDGVSANNHFIPKDWLNDKGWLRANEQQRVYIDSPTDVGHLGVYAIGDIVADAAKAVHGIDEQASVVMANLKADIQGTSPSDQSRLRYEKPTEINSMMIPIGKSSGTGLMFGMVMWQWLVWLIKGRNYFVPYARWFLSK